MPKTPMQILDDIQQLFETDEYRYARLDCAQRVTRVLRELHDRYYFGSYDDEQVRRKWEYLEHAIRGHHHWMLRELGLDPNERSSTELERERNWFANERAREREHGESGWR